MLAAAISIPGASGKPVRVDVEVDLGKGDDLVADDDGDVVPALVAAAVASDLAGEAAECFGAVDRERDRDAPRRALRSPSRSISSPSSPGSVSTPVAGLPSRALGDHAGTFRARRPAAQLAVGARWADRGLEVVEREALAAVLAATGCAGEKQQSAQDESANPVAHRPARAGGRTSGRARRRPGSSPFGRRLVDHVRQHLGHGLGRLVLADAELPRDLRQLLLVERRLDVVRVGRLVLPGRDPRLPLRAPALLEPAEDLLQAAVHQHARDERQQHPQHRIAAEAARASTAGAAAEDAAEQVAEPATATAPACAFQEITETAHVELPSSSSDLTLDSRAWILSVSPSSAPGRPGSTPPRRCSRATFRSRST